MYVQCGKNLKEYEAIHTKYKSMLDLLYTERQSQNIQLQCTCFTHAIKQYTEVVTG